MVEALGYFEGVLRGMSGRVVEDVLKDDLNGSHCCYEPPSDTVFLNIESRKPLGMSGPWVSQALG